MKAAIIFLITAIATIGTASSQTRTAVRQGKANHTPGLHIQLVDGTTDADLPIEGGKILLIAGKDTISLTTGRNGQVSYTKPMTSPTTEIIAIAEGFKTYTTTMKSLTPSQAMTRTFRMQKPKN